MVNKSVASSVTLNGPLWTNSSCEDSVAPNRCNKSLVLRFYFINQKWDDSFPLAACAREAREIFEGNFKVQMTILLLRSRT